MTWKVPKYELSEAVVMNSEIDDLQGTGSMAKVSRDLVMTGQKIKANPPLT